MSLACQQVLERWGEREHLCDKNLQTIIRENTRVLIRFRPYHHHLFRGNVQSISGRFITVLLDNGDEVSVEKEQLQPLTEDEEALGPPTLPVMQGLLDDHADEGGIAQSLRSHFYFSSLIKKKAVPILRRILDLGRVSLNQPLESLGSSRGTSLIYPLHYAVQQGHPEVVELFLSYEDVNLEVQDSEGHTPLVLAVRSHETLGP
jgi:hypothetical protein